MTNVNGGEDIRGLLAELTRAQVTTQQQIQETNATVKELSSEVTRVLARSAVLDDVLLELRDSHEQHQQNFEEHQKSTNAALERLEAILLQIIPRNNGSSQ
jgi:predicted  nucleic acid-binding Zn-ribbon protein